MILKNDNDSIVITGASSPLGLEIVKWAISNQFNVIACSRRKTKDLEKLIGTQGNNRLFVGDLTDFKYIKNTMKSVKKSHKKIRLLVNNASGWHSGGLDNTPILEIKKQVDASITGTMYITKMCLPLLTKSGRSHIVNICSTVGTGYRFSPNTLYVVLKGALEYFGRSLRNDLRNKNVKITNLHLGKVEDGELSTSPRVLSKDVCSALDFIISISPNSTVDDICITPIKFNY